MEKDKNSIDDVLDNVNGGNDPEEFDWKTKGYVTPVKSPVEGQAWHYEAIGNKEDNLKKLRENENN